MGFLQSAFLAGLALVSVPLILHLFTRRRVQNVVFPALMLLAGSKRRSMRIMTLQQLLVLICRMAAVGCLATAFALPVLPGARLPLPGTRTQTALHIVLDNSPSMGWESGGVSLYDRAKSAAKKLAGSASYEDEVTLEFACGGPGTTQSMDGLAKMIEDSRPGNCRAPLDRGINRAIYSLRRSTVAERRLVVFSDFQSNGFALKPPVREKTDARLIGVNFGAGRRRNNARVTRVELPMFPLVGEDVRVCFRVESDMRPELALTASLAVDGVKRGEQAVALDKSGRGGACFAVTSGEKGRHSGAVSISGDAMPGDNTRYFIFDVREEITALMVAPPEAERDAGSGAFYFARAIRTIASGQGGRTFRLSVSSPASLDGKTVSENRLVIVPDAGVLTKENISLLGGYIADGGGLFLASSGGTPKDSIIAGTLFGDGISVSGHGAEKEAGRTGGTGGFLTVGQIDTEHPVFRDLSGNVGAAFRETRFYSPAAVRVLSPEVTAPLTLPDGGPLMVERKLGRGRVILLASSLGPGATNLALKPAFVPVVVRLCKYLGAPAAGESRDFVVGHDVRLDIPAPEGVKGLKAKNRETGEVAELRRMEGAAAGAFLAEDGRSLPAGIYEVSDGEGGAIDLFTVNTDSAESDLKSLTGEEWKSRYRGFDVFSIDAGRFTDTERLKELVFARRAAALWFPFLLGAILFLFLEMTLSNRK